MNVGVVDWLAALVPPLAFSGQPPARHPPSLVAQLTLAESSVAADEAVALLSTPWCQLDSHSHETTYSFADSTQRIAKAGFEVGPAAQAVVRTNRFDAAIADFGPGTPFERSNSVASCCLAVAAAAGRAAAAATAEDSAVATPPQPPAASQLSPACSRQRFGGPLPLHSWVTPQIPRILRAAVVGFASASSQTVVEREAAAVESFEPSSN